MLNTDNLPIGQYSVHDVANNVDVQMQEASVIYGPVKTDNFSAHKESTVMNVNGKIGNVEFDYPDKPDDDSYRIDMWNVLDAYEDKAWNANNVGLKTGFPLIDKGFDNGIHPGFIIIGAGANHGKTSFLSQMAWQIATLNSDAYVMDFSLDDAMADKLARVIASSAQIIINAVKTPRSYLDCPLMLVRRKRALLQLREHTDRYRAYDSNFSTFIEDIEAEIENKLIYFKANNINKKLVVCIDNFHDLNSKAKEKANDKEKYDYIAQWCADIAIKYDIILICTAELRKLNNGKRPSCDDIRETTKIQYEAKAILLCHNDLHFKGENSNIFFTLPNNPFKKPIFEVRFAKNKISSFKGTVFFEFYPEMAYLKECDDARQKTLTAIAYGGGAK